MANGATGFGYAIESIPKPIIVAIQFIIMGVFIGIWWHGNQTQINDVKLLKESVDKLRGEISTIYISRRDFKDLENQVNWRLRRVNKRLGLDYQDIKVED